MHGVCPSPMYQINVEVEQAHSKLTRTSQRYHLFSNNGHLLLITFKYFDLPHPVIIW